MPRIQPETIIQQLEADNSRLAKEAILAEAMSADIPEFFEGLQMALSPFVTFGVKAIDEKSESGGQGLSWENFKQLALALQNRSLTGNEARAAIKLAMDVATQEQWNRWYKLILQKDLRCGVSEKTVNSVAKKAKKPEYSVSVFSCQLSNDSAQHESKLTGKKVCEKKLDGIRCLTVIDYEAKTVVQYTRNGKILENFGHTTEYLKGFIEEFGRSYVLDGEIMSSSFQDLMKQVHRKDNVNASDAVLNLFDIVPLTEFKQGISTMGQRRRSQFLKNFENIFNDSGFITIVPQREFDLDVFTDEIDFRDYMKQMIAEGYEGIMIKDPDAKYECKRSSNWLKMKPFIEVSLTVTAVEEGTGRNKDKLGALVVEGTDDGKHIVVNVGSGFSDEQRSEFWAAKDTLIGQVVEVRADAATRSQDSEVTYSLRFPRFLRFRGFSKGEKI
jgi:DNA ligase-1